MTVFDGRLRGMLTIAAITALSTTAVIAADLRGALQGGDSLSPSARAEPPRYRGSFWDAPNGAVTLTAPRANIERDVGVVLTGPGIAESTQGLTIAVEGGRCRPGTVVISPRTNLTLDNRDLLAHELFAVARGQTERVIPAEVTSAGTRRQVSFATAGVYEIRDVRQPSFRCWVVVGPGQGRVLAVNSTGAFAAVGLGDGEFTATAWYEGTNRAHSTFTVAGQNVQVTVALGGAAAATGAAPAATPPANPNAHGRR